MLAVVLLGAWFYWNADQALAAAGQALAIANIGVGYFLLPIILILLWMASSAIKKDEKLVRSADRLR